MYDPQKDPVSEVDVPLLEYNLSLTYEERLAQHDSALGLFIDLQNAGRAFRENQNDEKQGVGSTDA